MTSERTKIVCILPRLGTRVGGGKINAIYKRMNVLVERADTDVVLLTVQHGVNQKRAFAQLVEDGRIDPRVSHASLYEFCTPPQHAGPDTPDTDLPPWDQQTAKGGRKTRITFSDGDTPVMRDTVEQTPAGPLLVRNVLTQEDADVRLKYLNDDLVESVRRGPDGISNKTLYVRGEVVCEMQLEHSAFRKAYCAITGKTFWSETALQKALVEKAFPSDCIVFIDGITTAYLASHISARKVLFLHADHRDATGKVVPRSRYLIENFNGDAIVTATRAHRSQLERDLAPPIPIRVIPHSIEAKPRARNERRHICTVSRLELGGKPIHQAIEAFTRVMHQMPGCDYLIYGSGIGEDRLAQLIKHHGCEDRVHLLGHTADPAEVFASSLFSIAPTLTEGFGLSLLESLAQDCPVISYDVDYGPRELITPGENGELVTPGDIAGLSEAILKVYENVAAYRATCQDSIAAYSAEAYHRNYMTLIDEVLKANHVFDITASDLVAEVRRVFPRASTPHKLQLLDLLISLCTEKRDLGGLYAAFLQKRSLLPNSERPLMRCIWLSRKLGRAEACAGHLRDLAHSFPESYQRFLEANPDFSLLVETP